MTRIAGESPKAADRKWWLLTIVILAAGVLLRLQQYLLERSLWIDEARLALSIVPLRDAQLFGPLLYDQVSPPGFLAVSRLLVLVFGPSELSLRLLSLVAGCAALMATAYLARRIAGEVVSALAVLTLAASPAAIYYSQEFKHYSCDLLFGVLLPLLAMAAIRDAPSRIGKRMFAAACVVAVWFSASGVLVAAGALGALVAIGMIRRSWSMVAMAAGVGVLTVCSFGFAYSVSYRFASNGDLMRAFWEGAYLNVGSISGVLESFGLAISAGWGMLAGPRAVLGYVVKGSYAEETILALLTLGLLAASVWGALRLVGRGAGDQAMVMCSSGAVFIAASLLEAYPASTRLLMFLAGPWVVMSAVGLADVAERALGAGGKYVALLAVATACVAGAPVDGKWRMADAQWSDARPLVQEALTAKTPLYLYARAVPQFMYYAFYWRSPEQVRQAALYRVSEYGGAVFENASDYRAGIASPELARLAEGGLIVGLSTGMRFSPSFGWSRPQPAAGWAETEAARIGLQAAEHVQLLFMHQIDGAETFLREALDKHGWSCMEEMRNYDELLVSCNRSRTSGQGARPSTSVTPSSWRW